MDAAKRQEISDQWRRRDQAVGEIVHVVMSWEPAFTIAFAAELGAFNREKRKAVCEHSPRPTLRIIKMKGSEP